jgi:hypothetical protein
MLMRIESADEFRRLRQSEDPAEYRRAAHGELSDATCREIIDRFPDMKFWVAHNKTVPLEILRVLSVDPEVRVRTAVAMKRKLDDRLFSLLSQDPHETVRHAVARNAKCPLSVLRVLTDDPSDLIREAASRRLAQRGIP